MMLSLGITNRLPVWDMTFSMKWTVRFDGRLLPYVLPGN